MPNLRLKYCRKYLINSIKKGDIIAVSIDTFVS